MFVDTSQLIDVVIYYKAQGHRFMAFSEKEFKGMKLPPEKTEEYQILNAQMRVLTWGKNNELNENAMVEDDEGNRRFNYKLFKEGKLQALMAKWDAKDKNGKPVAITPQILATLSPSIAEAILNTYDDLSGSSEEELGN